MQIKSNNINSKKNNTKEKSVTLSKTSLSISSFKTLTFNLSNNIQDNESNKINDWKGEADKVISDFKNEINSLENNCKDVKNSDYWEKKFQFIKNQIDNLNNFKKKLIEYQNFLDYVGGEIKSLSEKITSSPQ